MGRGVGRVAMAAFWISAGTIAATYVGFPALLLVRGRVVRRPVAAADITPDVSLVIAAHDEELSIGAKLDNVLALDYPVDRIQVLIASDGSTDRTNATSSLNRDINRLNCLKCSIALLAVT